MIDFEEIKRKFGHNLSNLISARGSTQVEIANLMDVTPASVCVWAKGEKMPSIEKVILLADLLCVTVSELIGKVGAKNFENSKFRVFPVEEKQCRLDKKELESMQYLKERGVLDENIYYNYLAEKLKEIAE